MSSMLSRFLIASGLKDDEAQADTDAKAGSKGRLRGQGGEGSRKPSMPVFFGNEREVGLVSAPAYEVDVDSFLDAVSRSQGRRAPTYDGQIGDGTITIVGGAAALGNYSGPALRFVWRGGALTRLPELISLTVAFTGDDGTAYSEVFTVEPRAFNAEFLIIPTSIVAGMPSVNLPRIVGHATTPTNLTVVVSGIPSDASMTCFLLGQGNPLWNRHVAPLVRAAKNFNRSV